MRKVREMKLRNPIARDLHSPKYRQRIVKDPNQYSRKVKHKKIDLEPKDGSKQ